MTLCLVRGISACKHRAGGSVVARTIEPGKLIFDGTLGGGGHTEALLQHGARIVAMDQDDEALGHAKERLKGYSDRFCALKGNFRDFPAVLAESGVGGLDGMLIDIGVSSHHLDAAERGFSLPKDGPPHRRMDTNAPLKASDIVNTWAQEDIERVLRENAEEQNARRLARAICQDRVKTPFITTLQLAEMIARVCPKFRAKPGADRGSGIFRYPLWLRRPRRLPWLDWIDNA